MISSWRVVSLALFMTFQSSLLICSKHHISRLKSFVYHFVVCTPIIYSFDIISDHWLVFFFSILYLWVYYWLKVSAFILLCFIISFGLWPVSVCIAICDSIHTFLSLFVFLRYLLILMGRVFHLLNLAIDMLDCYIAEWDHVFLVIRLWIRVWSSWCRKLNVFMV